MHSQTQSHRVYPHEALGPPGPIALAPPDRAGDLGRFGPYRVRGLISDSTPDSVVYRADDYLDRSVALKLLRPEAAANPMARDLFFRGARAQARLSDPRVPAVHAAGETDGLPFLAMQYLEGQTLRARMQAEPLPLGEAVPVAGGVAEGLAVLHRAGVVHRDVKPANIFLPAGGATPVIIDFGLARGPDEPDPPPGEFAGTPAYMSPEQSLGGPLGPGTDLFSLGVVIYELATGRRPFNGPNRDGLLGAIRDQPPPALREFVPDVSPALDELVGRLLDKNPTGRPSAEAVVRELAAIERQWIGRRPRSDRPAPDPEPLSEFRAGARMGTATDEELARAIIEFEGRFPLPERGASAADARWFDEHQAELLERYRGTFVAVFGGTVVGAGPNALQLQLDTARTLDVHPQRLIVEYVPEFVL